MRLLNCRSPLSLFSLSFLASLILAGSALAESGDGTITVRLFDDVAYDGNHQSPEDDASTITGATVTITDPDGTQLSLTDLGTGFYSLDANAQATLNGGEYVVEVDGATLPSGLGAGLVGNNARSFVEVVDLSGSNDVTYDVPLNSTQVSCGAGTNTDFVTTCFIMGKHDSTNAYANLSGPTIVINESPALVGFSRSSMSTQPSIQNRYLVNIGDVGAINGLAVQQGADGLAGTIFAAAYARRHADYGPRGTNPLDVVTAAGTIYAIDAGGGGVQTTFIIPNASPGVPRGIDAVNSANDGTDLGFLRDSLFFDAVGKESIGDIEISADEATLWAVNLNDRHLYSVDVASTSATFGVVTDLGVITNPCATASDWRPFALKVHEGEVYVGGVCSAESSGNTANLDAFVFRLNNPTVNASDAALVLQYDMDYDRGPVEVDWKPWVSAWDRRIFYGGDGDLGTTIAAGSFATFYAQPIFSDIEFDSDGDMILGFRDRFNDQIGVNTLPPGLNVPGDTDLGSGSVLEGVSLGEIFHACFIPSSGATSPSTGINGDWTPETDPLACGDTNLSNSLPNDNDPNDDPSINVAEYYWRTSYGALHPESAQGGLSVHPDVPDSVFSTIQDPFFLRSGGVTPFSTITGQSPFQHDAAEQGDNDAMGATGGYMIFRGQASTGLGLAGKTQGLGDLEFLCLGSPVQLGNFVWFDADEDGIQDGDEPVIEGATVRLFKDSDNDGDIDDLVQTTTTDAAGQFFVSAEPDDDCIITFDLTTALPVGALDPSGMLPTTTDAGANDAVDSDINTNLLGSAGIALTTSTNRLSDHTFDGGFVCLPTSITCPADQTINANASCQGSVPDFTGSATIGPVCTGAGSVTVTQSPTAGSTISGAGTVQSVTLLATNTVDGSTDTCSVSVTLEDATPPSITCPGNQTASADASCNVSLPDYTGLATAGDNCDPSPAVTQSPAPGTTISGAGTVTAVTLTATDASGNSANCNFNMTVVDVTPPSITCPSDQTVAADASCNVSLPNYTGLASTSDNCDPSPSVTQSPAPGSTVSGAGTSVTVTLTSTDASGNSANCNFNMTVVDVTPPSITCPSDQTVAGDASCQASLANYTGLATTSDNCDASPAVTQSPLAGTTISASTTVTLTSTDASGNSASCNFNVSIVDTVDPVASCQDITIQLDGTGNVSITAADVDAGSTDNCGIQSLSVSPNTFTCADLGANTVTLTVTDTSGNTDQCTATVTVEDNVPPVVTAPADQTVVVNALCQYILPDLRPSTTVVDNCDPTPTVVQSPIPGTVFQGDGLAVTVTITATDAEGNAGNDDIVITLDDQTDPAVVLPADVTVECDADNSSGTTGTATGTDNCSTPGNITIGESDSTAAGTCAQESVITRTWTATDEAGNSANANQTITVVDTTAPVVTPPADATVECDADNSSAATGAATATDNCSAPGNISIAESESVAAGTCAQESVITRTWTATDECGNSSTQDQTITVVDTTAPVVTTPADATVECDADSSSTATGTATATDNCSLVGDITIAESDSVAAGTCAQESVITRTWTATDECGNNSSLDQTITVIDTTAPVVTTPADATVECDADSSSTATGTATATDNCSLVGDITIAESDSVAAGTCAQESVITRTWTATDECGNSSSLDQTITVVDTTAPVVTTPADATVECDADSTSTATGTATATDNCSLVGDITIAESDSVAAGTCAQESVITRTWTATDECGNSSSLDQTITVVDTTAPVVTTPADATVECDADSSSTATGTATATDNCSLVGDITIAESESVAAGTCAQESVITRTWTATDECGNSSSLDQTITVVDTTAPVVTTPTDATVECDADSSSTATGTATATDNCSLVGDITIAESDSVAAGTCAQESVITRTWTATDECGNSSSFDQTITVIDTTAPVLTLPADATVECDADSTSTATGTATATDNCSLVGDITIAESDSVAAGTCAQESVITRTWTATDECGNSSSLDQTITVIDTTSPVLTLPPDVTVICNDPITPADTGMATASDNCDPSPVITFSDSSSGTEIITVTRTWVATDDCGNATTNTQSIVRECASLGDFVWFDNDFDGVQDGGSETGVVNVTVRLLDPLTTNQLDQTTTDGNGLYSFTELDPGNYFLEFLVNLAQPGYLMTFPNQGGNDNLDSDPDRFLGRTIPTTLVAGENDTSWDAGIFDPASIGDFVWEDINGNGVQDGGEPGVAGVTVRLFDANTNAVKSIVTDTNGFYILDNLVPGDYFVEFDPTTLPAGFEIIGPDQGGSDAEDSDGDQVTGRTIPTTLSAGEFDPTWDLGVYQPACLGNYVWRDANSNGVQDVESGVNGITVNLYRDDGDATREPGGDDAFLSSTVTITGTNGAAGFYEFCDLVPGPYFVEFVLPPAGVVFTTPDAVGDDTVDSDADIATGLSPITQLDSGEIDPTLDAGLLIQAVIDIEKTTLTPLVVNGDDAQFSITVTNAGFVDLTNVQVSDPLGLACEQTVGDLPVGASTTYICTVVGVTADFTNTASVVGDDPFGGKVNASNDAPVDVINPGLRITKEPVIQQLPSGATAAFNITVTNTGDVVLSNVEVTDPMAPLCDSTIGTLAVGGASSYMCTLANVTQDLRNIVMVTGEDPLGNVLMDDDTAEVVILDPDGGCTRPLAFWTAITANWLEPEVVVGDVLYSEAQGRVLLNLDPGADVSILVAQELMAAILNGLTGADVAAVQTEIAQADAWLRDNPVGSNPSGSVAATGAALAAALADFNSGLIGPGACVTCPTGMDFDGDTIDDVAVYDPAVSHWYIKQSHDHALEFRQWGFSTSIPAAGDYDGDGITDVTVYDPATGSWYVSQSSTGTLRVKNWGFPGTIPVQADFTGDCITDFAVYDPQTGTWYIHRSEDGSLLQVNWGFSGTVPVPADYDGDGIVDIAVYDPATGDWFIRQSGSGGALLRLNWGWSEAVPVPGDYDGDGIDDVAVYHPAAGKWYIRQSGNAGALELVNWGFSTTIPVPLDYDGDGICDVAVYNPPTGEWYVRESATNTLNLQSWGWSTARPVSPQYQINRLLGLLP